MDYKTYALMSILMASVASVALTGAAFAQTTLTVETDADSYATGDDITISGQLDATNINQPILLQVLDPQGNRDRIDQVEVAADGSYSYTFRAGGLMNTNGEYTVVVSYKTTEEETTFQFASSDAGWEEIDLMIDGEAYEVEYMITGTGNSLDSLTGNFEEKSVTAAVTAASAGTLSLRFDEDIFDADSEFAAFADEVSVEDSLPAGPGATNTLHIDFDAGTEEIVIVGEFLVPEFGAIAAIILAVAIVGIIVATARYGKFNFAPRL
jgi:predicted secreted protein with PEFG-CTERM motif